MVWSSMRDTIIQAFEGEDINYLDATSALSSFVNDDVKLHSRYKLIASEFEQFNEGYELCEEQPYEEIRKLALLVDICNNLMHVYDDDTMALQNLDNYNNGNRMAFLKSFMLRLLAKRCIKLNKDGRYNINIGTGFDISMRCATLCVDLPNVGQLGWHFGKNQDFKGFFEDLGGELKVYSGRFLEKKLKGSNIKYTNGDLLTNSVRLNQVNENDYNLIFYGTREPDKSSAQNLSR